MAIKQVPTGYKRLLCLLWSGGIAFFSLLPGSVAVSTGWSDKIEHGLAFAGLAILGRLGWAEVPALRTFMFCILFGALIEIAQMFSPGRHADRWDLLADAIGVSLGLLALMVWPRSQDKGA